MSKSSRECREPPCKVARLEVDETLERASTSKSVEIIGAGDYLQEKKWPSWNKTSITRASGGAELLVNSYYEDDGTFQLIDEVTGDDDEDDDNDDIDSDESDEYSYDSEVPEEEIDALLEEGLPEEMKGPRKRRREPNIEEEGYSHYPQYEEKEKMVLVEKGSNHFEILPEGWVQVTHNSGMPVYLHRPSRVCTMAKPYFLGQGSVRKHDIPVSGVPCLHYLRALLEEVSGGNDKTAGTEKTAKNTQDSDILVETPSMQNHDASTQVSSEQILNGISAASSDIQGVFIATSQNTVEPPPPTPPQFSPAPTPPPPLPTDPPLPNSPPVPSPPPVPSSPTDSDAPAPPPETPPLPTDAPPLPSSPPSPDDISACPVAHGSHSLKETQISIEPPPPTPPPFSPTPPPPPLPTDPPLPNSPPVPSPPPVPSSPTESDAPPLPTDAPPLPSSPPAPDDTSDCPVAHGLHALKEHIRNESAFNDENSATPPPGLMVGNAKIETAIENLQQQSLTAVELRDYCQKRFLFKALKIIRFKTWAERRIYQKAMKKKDRPQLPEGTKLISLRRHDEDSRSPNSHKKEWIMNPKGKSYVCILHEYVQHALKKQPRYVFKEVENASTPYAATIVINDMHYCTGYGSSKKVAKVEAAKGTLEILLPELGRKIREETNTRADDDLSFFDEIRIEDPNVPELCNKTSELTPYSILLNCLQRNFGLSGANIESKLITQKNQKNEYIMSVGKHTVQVQCKNKKDGKQKASQAILQKLHPHIHSWGSLLRLYGNRSMQSMREKKAEEQEITLLQSNATLNQPNTSIINKLKHEMLKLHVMKKSIQPIGKFLPPENTSFPSSSGIDLNNVDL